MFSLHGIVCGASRTGEEGGKGLRQAGPAAG